MQQPDLFNPLAYESISASISDALMRSENVPLAELESFDGPGVYVLFYEGDFQPYRLLGDQNRRKAGSWPIYIGKAAPSTRKGKDIAPDDFSGKELYTRLKDHCKSIRQATNLDIADFSVKMLILSYIWVPMAETAMITMYQPLWNTLIDGFGNHDPGSGRANGRRSRWDTLHPGRPWASKYPAREEKPELVVQEAVQHLKMSIGGGIGYVVL
ncbi:Eco29kI family restriction endonuclease [Bifidobacterium oedipodis]|uniref:Type II restriction endonuclease Eco29kI n=1 Tax=Bifidobacterium oedipodis TaxID=2675322 RepID=A0A7Y0EQX2_9BIFI|nr:Eco29kI family restriction endonuclease [Bifidobacterium sp. DSM 109957]NMM94790.1 type II restriction endonuclease Eco29kI [Bifidobacterium sp. DSM 109957]